MRFAAGRTSCYVMACRFPGIPGSGCAAGCLMHSSAWSGGSLGERPASHDALEKCLAAHGAAEIHWDQIGRAPYDRAHGEL